MIKVTCGAELAVLFVESLVKGKIPCDDETIGQYFLWCNFSSLGKSIFSILCGYILCTLCKVYYSHFRDSDFHYQWNEMCQKDRPPLGYLLPKTSNQILLRQHHLIPVEGKTNILEMPVCDFLSKPRIARTFAFHILGDAFFSLKQIVHYLCVCDKIMFSSL